MHIAVIAYRAFTLESHGNNETPLRLLLSHPPADASRFISSSATVHLSVSGAAQSEKTSVNLLAQDRAYLRFGSNEL